MPTHVEYARKQHKATREAVGWRSRGYLPHFDVPGLVQMLTFRLSDALPRTVVQPLALDPRYRSDSARRERIQEYLDAGHGACYLRAPEIAELVQGALLHFDDERYRLLAWSVMPNHVHVLVEMLPGFALDSVAHSWKSFTANQANRRLGRSGSFWQVECFDRYIRDETHLRNAIAYIHGNVSRFSSAPVSAGWKPALPGARLPPKGLHGRGGDAMKGRRRDRFGVSTWLLATLASAAVMAASPAQAAAGTSAVEQRIVVPVPVPGVPVDDVGSCTVEQLSSGLLWITFGARPGEEALLTFPAMQPLVCEGEGSEIAFGSRVDAPGLTLVPAAGQRLCLKKTPEGWVWVCGRGQVTYPDGRVVELGDKRAVDSCLDLLSSSDPILREGGARDLGRLTTAEEAQRVTPRLVPLLQDSVPHVRRGAAEGLGLIGRQECVTALRAAESTEQEELTKKYIAEALALCAGNTLMGAPNAPELLGTEAAKVYLEGRTGWADDILAQRIQARGGAGAQTLIARLGSSAAAERQAAARLLGAAKRAEAREALTKLSTDDPDDEVKAAAKAALDELSKP